MRCKRCLVAAAAGTATAVSTAATGTTAASAATVSAATTTSAAAVAAATGTTAASAATVTAASTSTTAEAAATRAGRTGFHRTGFVDHQATTAELLAIHAIDCSLCLSVAAHFHKAEAFGAARVTFHHDFCAGDCTVRSKGLLQVFVTERIRQVAYVKFVAHERTPQNNSKRDGVQNRNQQTNKDLEQTRN